VKSQSFLLTNEPRDCYLGTNDRDRAGDTSMTLQAMVTHIDLGSVGKRSEIQRCEREIAVVEQELLSGHPDVPGLCLALSDWSAELRILRNQERQSGAVAQRAATVASREARSRNIPSQGEAVLHGAPARDPSADFARVGG
jgi:hypothetical protein